MSDASAIPIELSPHPEVAGPFVVDWSRDLCRLDLEAVRTLSASEIEDRLDQYYANFRLTLDQRGPGFQDSVGEWHAVPSPTRRVVTLNMHARPHGTPGRVTADRLKRLLFLDSDGNVTLIVPNYGWNLPDLRRWVETAGWDSDISAQLFEGDEFARHKAFPGFLDAPDAPVGRPLIVPEPKVRLGNKLMGRFRRS